MPGKQKTPPQHGRAAKRNIPGIDLDKQAQKLLWLVFIIYAIMVCYGVTNHEPWRDEAQSWLVTRDLDLSAMLRFLPSEGHPPLWYLLVRPLSRSELPYITQQWLAAAFMTASVYIMLFRTKLPFVIKLLTPFSYFFLFEYSLIARSYCLIFFFVNSIICLYPKRFDKPLLFALCVVGLFNTHILLFSFSAMLTCIYIADLVQYKKGNVRTWGSVVLMFAGGLYLIPYLILTRSAKTFEDHTDHLQRIERAVGNGLLIDGNIALGLLLLTGMTLLLARRTKPLILLLTGAMGVLYILGYKYGVGEVRHQGVLFVMVFTAYAIAPFYVNDDLNITRPDNSPMVNYGIWGLAIVMTFQMPAAFHTYMNDKDGIFSDAKNAAMYIREHQLEHSIIIGQQAWAASALAPYLPNVKFYYSECQRYGTYYINDSCYTKNKWMLPSEYALATAARVFPSQLDSVVFVLNSPVKPSMEGYVDLLYATPDTPMKQDETFYIYRLK